MYGAINGREISIVTVEQVMEGKDEYSPVMEGKDEHSPVQTQVKQKQKENIFLSLLNMDWKGTFALVFWFLHKGIAI